MAHHTVPVKVTAWVDEGVAPLVVALNQFPGVMTLDSCEGDSTLGAYVMFRADGGERFARTLAVQLGGSEFLLRAEWLPGYDDGEPLLTLSCPPDLVQPLAERLARIVNGF